MKLKPIMTGIMAAVLLGAWSSVEAARVAKMPVETTATNANGKAEGDFAAERLVEKAKELILAQEYDRGVKMLENVIDQYPKSRVRYKASLALGNHLLNIQKYNEAIHYLRGLNDLNKPGTELSGENRDWYLEAQYSIGMAYFNMRQYGNAFTALRAITRDYPNTVWANQAYYYIGMCHFAQKNWNKVIESLTMVGTFIDPDSSAVEYTEAGRRFYVKSVDADIPVLYQTGNDIKLQVSTKNGDREIIICAIVGTKEGMAMGSIPTAAGLAVTNDGILQVIGGDVITIKYYDDNTEAGEKDVLREKTVKVVSTAQISFTTGTYESQANAAYLGQPVFIYVNDLDRDASVAADKITVRVVSRYKPEKDESLARSVDTEKLILQGDEREYEIRDEATVTLAELGTSAVHSGRFGGSIMIQSLVEGVPPNKSDNVLTCGMDDDIVAFYTDEMNIDGAVRRDATATLLVVGEIDGRPMVTQNVVFDPVVKAKKQIVEATAYLQLTRIFKSMGLMKNAVEKANQGMERVQDIILAKTPIPSRLKEEAFQIKWDLQIEIEDFTGAVATCQLFSRLFPTSSFADEALMKIGMVKLETKDIPGAIKVFTSILSLPNSQAKAEARYRIAEAQETSNKSIAMQTYKQCAEQFPDSEYAGKALGKLADYYIESKEYNKADQLLEQIFQDYPDASFLDSMLLKWVIAAYQMGNYDKAREKCTQLLFEYPGNQFAAQAKTILSKLERKIKE
ncbi:MAG: tetratricopeptide repeat protein [Kiritimatiellae bacterium]|nr:tetratricopeptide repeat protein [Kiritimatiellia bacterium]